MTDAFVFRAPATSANLGPGFGVLGLALDIGFTVRVERTDHAGHEIERAAGDRLSALDQRHDHAWRALHDTAERFSIKLPAGLRISLEGGMPRGCGLGSNAAEFAAGIGAAIRFAKQQPDQDDLLDQLVELGGDPAHGVAALHGGLAIAVPIHVAGKARRHLAIRLPLHDEWHFVIVAPRVQLGTADVHRVVPPSVPNAVTQRTAGRLAGMLHALSSGDERLLGYCVADEVHVPFRQRLIPGMVAAMDAARATGVQAVTISGHGPALIAATIGADPAAVGAAMVAAFAAAGVDTVAHHCRAGARGALA